MDKLRYLVARLECDTDTEACEKIGISRSTLKRWGRPVRRAVELAARDGVELAIKLRRNNLAKAMAVKAAGLESDNERIRQSVATEIIEWELGKATQKAEVSGPGGTAVPVEVYGNALSRVYGDGSSDD